MITKRADGRYQTRVTITVRGKKTQKYFYGKTEKEVKRKLAEFQTNQIAGRFFGEVAEEWKIEHFARVAHKTTECYNAPFKRIIEQFGSIRITSITPQMLSLFIIQVSKQGFSLRTVRAHIAVLNMIFKFSVLNGYTETNPAEYITPPKGLKTTRREIPEDDQLRTIKNSCDKFFGLFAYLILFTGCRRGEALALRYEDIDFEKKIIKIRNSLYFENNKPVIKTTKTESGKRDVVLLDPLIDKLDRNSKGYIFNTDGAPITLSAFQKRWKRYQKESGVNITPHQIRHAYATILYEAGIDEKMAQELLGHANISTTLNIYTHIRNSRKEDAAQKLNAFFA